MAGHHLTSGRSDDLLHWHCSRTASGSFEAGLLGDDRVGAGRQHDVGGQILCFEDATRFIGDDVCAGDVDGEGLLSQRVLQAGCFHRFYLP